MQILSFNYIVSSNSNQEIYKEISPPFSVYALLNANSALVKSTTPIFNFWK